MKVVKTVGEVVVPRAGVEPARPFGQRILSPQRLPFRHPGTHVKIARAFRNSQTVIKNSAGEEELPRELARVSIVCFS
jgi:hypothetical protein